MSRDGLGSGKRIFWNHSSGPIKTTFVSQGQFCFFFPLPKELGGLPSKD